MIFILLDFSLNQFKQTLKIIFDLRNFKYDCFMREWDLDYKYPTLYIYVYDDYIQETIEILTAMKILYKTVEKININEFKFLKSKINAKINYFLKPENVLNIIKVYRLAKEKENGTEV